MNKKPGYNSMTRLIIISLLVVIALGITALAVLPHMRQKTQETDSAASLQETDGAAAQDNSSWTGEKNDGLISYDGKKYSYNSHLSNYLLLGIDTAEELSQENGTVSTGYADAVFLLAYDRKEKTRQLLSIPRDTMTMITVYDASGKSSGTMLDHLSVQYAYGDGCTMSCRITCDAVSELMYEVPIQGYTAINLESIPYLVDAVGGVPLTVPDDSMEEIDPEFTKGAEVTLTAENAESYLRYRDTGAHQQALVRMERQKSFISAFADRVLELQRQDPHTITDIYESLRPHMVTNMSNDIYLDLADTKRIGKIVTIPGEGVETDLFDEYHVDDKELYKLILKVFYVEQP